MNADEIEQLRYPIGRRATRTSYSAESRAAAIATIEQTPGDLRRAVTGLTNAQLDMPYRPDGWTVRQLVHHVADAHMVLSVRIRHALTEVNPPVRLWDEVTWAELPDAKEMPVDDSLAVVDGVHARMVHLLKSLTPEQFGRAIDHPDWGRIPVDGLVEICAWHGKHHAAHASEFRKHLR
jgi:DinB superfamily